MSTIVLRSVKGTPLTNTEVDANFSNLNTDKLQIGGTFSAGTANGVLFLNASKVLTTGTGLTFNGTNVMGVGATVQAWTASARALQVGSYVGLATSANGVGVLSYNIYESSAGVFNYVASAGAQMYQQSSAGGHAWYTAPSGTAGNTISFTQAMTLTAAGALGLGSTSPQRTFQINAASPGIRIEETASGGAKRLELFVDGANGVIAANQSAQALVFQTVGSERARIDSSGNVGIGTSSPGSKLTVAGTGGTAVVGMVETGVRSWAIRAGGAATNTFDIADLTTGASRLIINSSGNLGLGVTPSAWAVGKVLQIGAANGAFFYGSNLQTIVGNNAYYDTDWRYGGTGIASRYEQSSAGNHVWYNAPSGTAGNTISFTQAMTLDASGNLGLGVTPSAWSGFSAFEVGAGGGLASTSATNVRLMQNAYFNGANWIYRSTSTAARYEMNGGTHAWLNAPSGTAGGAVTFTQAMTLDTLGNLLLGSTSSSGARFQAYPSASNGFEILNGGVSATNTRVLTRAPATAVFTGLELQSTSCLWVNGGGTRVMTLDTSGNLLVGATSASGKLHVAGDIYLAGRGTSFAIKTPDWRLYNNASNGFAFNNYTSDVMTIDSSGNVGIGVTNQTSRLDVLASTDAIGANLRGRSSDDIAVLKFATAANVETAAIDIRPGAAMIFAFGSSRTERARIDSSGNLQVQTGAVVVYQPAPASIAAAATLTNANIQTQIINTTGTTYTVTMPLGTTLETLVTWAGTNLGYNFTVINTASGTITMAVNTGVTALGALTIATGTSANFRIRRTGANTFVLYRLS